MASGAIIFRSVDNPVNSWTDQASALTVDGNAATYPATGAADPIIPFNADTSLPEYINITGLEITYTAKRGAGAVVDPEFLSFQFTIDGSTGVGTVLSGSALTDAFATETLGGSGTLVGRTWARSEIHQNDRFGILVRRAGGETKSRALDNVQAKVLYELKTYLDGSSSSFPSSADAIERVENGIGPDNTIRSLHPNTLGDALYNIEVAALGSTGVVRAAGYPFGQTLWLFSITVTGYVAPTSSVIYERNYIKDLAQVIVDRTTSNIQRTFRPKEPFQTVNCSLVGAIGWISTGGIDTPVYVSPRVLVTKMDERFYNFYTGFVVTGQTVASAITFYNNNDYDGAFVTATPVTTGNLTVKILAIGL